MGSEIVILGAGESGTGAALLGVAKGLEVFVSDNGPIAPAYKEELLGAGISFEENGHSVERVLSAAEVIKSPGIPENVPLIRKLHEKRIPVISEIEFAARYNKSHVIGVTGSNGKTTVVTWLTHILQLAAMDVVLAGNVGQSFARALINRQPDFFVLELSSFQLDGMFRNKCDTSVLLNITPDHLDRYDNKFENYMHSKLRIFQNQSNFDVGIFNADDKEITRSLKARDKDIQEWPFSLNKKLKTGAFLLNDELVFKIPNDKVSLPVSELALPGRHNIYNAMAVGLAALRVGVPTRALIEGLTHFSGVHHRLERVAEVNGVLYINDSKATNINSTWYALQSMTRPVVWIAGGTDKGNNYRDLESLVRQKVKALVCLGVDNRKLTSFFNGKVPHINEAGSMKEAFEKTARLAVAGDVVLLSPACASFDLFNNYQHRGQLFKQEVHQLLTGGNH